MFGVWTKVGVLREQRRFFQKQLNESTPGGDPGAVARGQSLVHGGSLSVD